MIFMPSAEHSKKRGRDIFRVSDVSSLVEEHRFHHLTIRDQRRYEI